MNDILVIPATLEDMPAIFALVKELASYENAENSVKTNEKYYKESFNNGLFKCDVAKINNKVVGISLYYPRFSTWKGKMMHLEDFVVQNEYRRKGIGKLLFENFLKNAQNEDCKMVVWDVLNWNTPAINFYKKYNTKFDNEWSTGKIYFE